MVRRNIKLTIAYDGGKYHGFQKQNNAIAVQNVLEKQLPKIFGNVEQMAIAGRTDTGVHAYGQVVNFFTEGTIPVDRIVRAANSFLPDDIVIIGAEDVADDFNARFSAKSKIYLYKIQQGEVLDPFMRNYAWYIRNRLDDEAMNLAMQQLIGRHDYSAFKASGSVENINPVRTIFEADCSRMGDILTIRFYGDGFLYHMVRNLVGTVVNVGKGKTSQQQFAEIFASLDRRKAGVTAPPQGLYLKKVFY